jgi:putative membrane protein
MARRREDSKHDERPLLPWPTRILIHWSANVIVLLVLDALLNGVHVKNAGALVEAAAVFGLLNVIVKPVLAFVTLPIAILTLGVARFFVALLMLVLTKVIVSGFHISGFWTLVKATLIVWIVNVVLDNVPGPWRLVRQRRRSAPGRRERD